MWRGEVFAISDCIVFNSFTCHILHDISFVDYIYVYKEANLVDEAFLAIS